MRFGWDGGVACTPGISSRARRGDSSTPHASHCGVSSTCARDAITRVFGEDERIVEAQQRAIDENPDHVFYNLNIDAGAMWARRQIDAMVDAEAQVKRGVRLAG